MCPGWATIHVCCLVRCSCRGRTFGRAALRKSPPTNILTEGLLKLLIYPIMQKNTIARYEIYFNPRSKMHYLRTINCWWEHYRHRAGKPSTSPIPPESLAVGIGKSRVHLSHLGWTNPSNTPRMIYSISYKKGWFALAIVMKLVCWTRLIFPPSLQPMNVSPTVITRLLKV